MEWLEWLKIMGMTLWGPYVWVFTSSSRGICWGGAQMAPLFACLTPWLKWPERLGMAGSSPYVSNSGSFVAWQIHGGQTYCKMVDFPQSNCSEEASRNASPLKTRLRTGQHRFCSVLMLKAATGEQHRSRFHLSIGETAHAYKRKGMNGGHLGDKLPHCPRREYMYLDTKVWEVYLADKMKTRSSSTFHIPSFHLGYTDNSRLLARGCQGLWRSSESLKSFCPHA